MSYDDLVLYLLNYDESYRIEKTKEHYFQPNIDYLYLISNNEFKHWITDQEYSRILSIHRSNAIDQKNTNKDFYKWKVGDVCIYDMEVSFITEMFDSRVVSLDQEGCGTTVSDQNNIIDMNLNNYNISCIYMYYYRKILKISDNKHHLMNIPDIYNLLCDKFYDEVLNKSQFLLEDFYNDIENSISNNDYNIVIDNIEIFTEKNKVLNNI